MNIFPGLYEGLFTNPSWWQIVAFIVDYGIKFIAIGFVPENRKPSASTAWLLVILLLPIVGLPLFLLLGSQAVTRRRHELQASANRALKERTANLPDIPPHLDVASETANTISLSRRLAGMPAVIAEDRGIYSNNREAIAAMTEAVDGATTTVHVLMYIFALDEETEDFVAALERAHRRGVSVKVLIDPIGSAKYPGYRRLKKRLNASGIPWHAMLPISLLALRGRRPDLRNHRKIVTIDGRRAFMGSLNMIAPSYEIKKNLRSGREWIDVVLDLGGDVVAHLDAVFAVDWASEAGTLPAEQEAEHPTIESYARSEMNLVQVLPSGPGFTTEPNLRVFNDLIYSATHRITVVSPYFVPDESLLMAITSAALAGIEVELFVNEESDQFMVGHAQQSYYQALLDAGITIRRYPAPYVLHSKFLIIDDTVATIGSSNLDMRSFGLNYEVTLLASGGSIVGEIIALADHYRGLCSELTAEEWGKRSFRQRYLDNLFRLTSALQ